MDEPRDVVAKLLNTATLLASCPDTTSLLERIMDGMIEISGAERGFLLTLNGGGEPTVAAARNIDGGEVQRAREKASRTVLGQVLKEQRPIVYADALDDEAFKASESVQSQKIRSVCAVPLVDRGTPVGAVYLDHRSRKGVFSPDHLDTINAFAAFAVVTLRNVRRCSSLEGEVSGQKEEIRQNRRALGERFRASNIVGRSRPMRELFAVIDKVAETTLPVLIQGESGVGKELVARAIHAGGPRRERPFISVNCGAVAGSLLESELFGHVRGAFTGADREKPGFFELAHTGTLFLDEIGCMSAAMQQGLLRVLQNGEVRRVGGKEAVKVDVRVIAAGNADLAQMVEDGEFREDLSYRLNVVPLRVPPLRERPDDIPLLAAHFLALAAKEAATAVKRLSPDALEKLTGYPWPGNIRELENLLRLTVVMTGDEIIDADDVKLPVRRKESAAGTAIVPVEEYIRRTYETLHPALDHQAIADKLGISRKALWEKRKRWENS